MKGINDASVEAGMKWIKIEGKESNYYLVHGLSVAMERGLMRNLLQEIEVLYRHKKIIQDKR